MARRYLVLLNAKIAKCAIRTFLTTSTLISSRFPYYLTHHLVPMEIEHTLKGLFIIIINILDKVHTFKPAGSLEKKDALTLTPNSPINDGLTAFSRHVITEIGKLS